MRSTKTTTLRRQLLLLTLWGLLPIALLGAWGIAAAIDQHRRELERSTLELSRALSSAVEAELNATVSALAGLSASPSLRQGNLRAFYGQARSEAAARESFQAIVLTDGSGTFLFNSDRPFGEGKVVDAESLKAAIASGKPVVGGVVRGEMDIAFPVRFPVFFEGKLAYVLTAAVRPDRILNVLTKQQVPPTWNAAVVDASGLRIARSKDQRGTTGRPVGPTLQALLRSDPRTGSGITVTNDGAEVYTGFTRAQPFGWAVVVGAPTAETRGALLRSLAWYLAGILASVAVCVYAAQRIARRLTTDIRAVRDQAVELGAGRPVALERSAVLEVDAMGRALSIASERLIEASASMREALAKAQAASAVKDQFLAMLGHELRNPLAPMLTALHLMDLKSGAATARERQIMRRQVTQMQSLVDDLLDVSRIVSGKFVVRSEPLDLTVVAERALETIQPAVQQRGKALAVVLPPAPVWIEGDENRLLQAVINLLTNALRFCPEGKVSLRLEAGEGSARIIVSDTGVGIDPQTLDRVFEPFYQAQQGVDRSSGGLGLGLAIVKAVAQLHGGHVTAKSAGLGRGSTFEVVLPTIPAPPRRAEQPAAPGAELTGKVLLVDDNIDALDTMAEMLRIAGHDVRAVPHPSDGLALVPQFLPDVAIFDIGLPQMDGYELALAARHAAPSWKGMLIALSGYGQDADKRRAAEAGFDMHLTKPADPAVLLEAVERLLQAQTRASSTGSPG
jgi:signal transduction histidine kinase/ActR/RegA family two-component response regulator